MNGVTVVFFDCSQGRFRTKMSEQPAKDSIINLMELNMAGHSKKHMLYTMLAESVNEVYNMELRLEKVTRDIVETVRTPELQSLLLDQFDMTTAWRTNLEECLKVSKYIIELHDAKIEPFDALISDMYRKITQHGGDDELMRDLVVAKELLRLIMVKNAAYTSAILVAKRLGDVKLHDSLKSIRQNGINAADKLKSFIKAKILPEINVDATHHKLF